MSSNDDKKKEQFYRWLKRECDEAWFTEKGNVDTQRIKKALDDLELKLKKG